MAVSLKHSKTSAIADNPAAVAAGEVVPSDWNAEHVLTQATNTILGRNVAGTGPTLELTPAQVASMIGAMSSAGGTITGSLSFNTSGWTNGSVLNSLTNAGTNAYWLGYDGRFNGQGFLFDNGAVEMRSNSGRLALADGYIWGNKNLTVDTGSGVDPILILNSSTGFEFRPRTTTATWARGLIAAKASDATRIGGAGFLGVNEGVDFYRIGFGADWWDQNTTAGLKIAPGASTQVCSWNGATEIQAHNYNTGGSASAGFAIAMASGWYGYFKGNYNSGSVYSAVGVSSGDFYIETKGNNALNFSTNNVIRAQITDRLYLLTQSHGYALDILGRSSDNYSCVRFINNPNTVEYAAITSNASATYINVSSGNFVVSTSASERLWVNQAGRVGINSPSYGNTTFYAVGPSGGNGAYTADFTQGSAQNWGKVLRLATTNNGGSDGPQIHFIREGHYEWGFGIGSNMYDLVMYAGGNTSGFGTERFKFRTDGHLTMTSTNPTIVLKDSDNRTGFVHVNSDTFYILTGANGADYGGWSAVGSGWWPFQVNLANNDASVGGNFTACYNVTAYSDERVKTAFAPALLTLDDILKLEPESFTRIDSNGLRQVGVRAQSLQKILPESVVADDRGYLSVNYGTAAIVIALNLAKEIAELKRMIYG